MHVYIKTSKTTFYENLELFEVELSFRVQKNFLKEMVFYRKLIFGGCAEAHSEPCQTSKMVRVVLLQNAPSYTFDRVLITHLG